MTLTLDWAVKGAALLLTAAGLYYGITAKMSLVEAQLAAVTAAQQKTESQLSSVEKTVQETYFTLKALKVIP